MNTRDERPDPPTVDPIEVLREHMKQMDLGQKGACETLINEVERARAATVVDVGDAEAHVCQGCAEHAARNIVVRAKLEEALRVYGGGATEFKSVVRATLGPIVEAGQMLIRESEK